MVRRAAHPASRSPRAVTVLSPDDRRLLARAVAAVRELAPDARVILYGSRARGEAQPDSDWDLLVLLPGPVNDERTRPIHDRLLDIQLETRAMLSALPLSMDEWESPLSQVSSFHLNVADDGIELTGVQDWEAPLPRVTRSSIVYTEGQMAEARETLVRRWMERAYETFADAEVLAQAERWNACVSRLYYACFYAVTALLTRDGRRFSKHGSVQELFNLHYGRTGIIPPDLRELYNELFKHRLAADYDPHSRFTEAQVYAWLADARRFLAHVESLLATPPAPPEDA